MSKQKKKRNKKHLPKLQVKTAPKTVKAHCKVCQTECKLWDGPEFISYRNFHFPNYRMDFLFVQQCDCWETTEDWMEIVES